MRSEKQGAEPSRKRIVGAVGGMYPGPGLDSPTTLSDPEESLCFHCEMLMSQACRLPPRVAGNIHSRMPSLTSSEKFSF